MFIYNVTVTVDDSVHLEWLNWMKTVHIPDVMRTGCFTENRICKLVTDGAEITYAVQYTFRNKEDLETYQRAHAPRLQKDHSEKFRDKFSAFRTVLEII